MAYGVDYNDAGDNGGPDSNEFYNDPGDGRVWDPTSQSWVWGFKEPLYDVTKDPNAPHDLGNDTHGTDTPAGPGTLGALGGLGKPGTLTAPFTDTFARPGLRDLPQIPGLTLPRFPTAAPFRDTTGADVTSDPGYAFLLGEGQKGVQQSAAARGLLNSGGTLKDIAKWTEDYAGTRFNDVDQRRRGDYLMNYQTQTLDPYRFAYQSALDSFAPQLTGWTTNASNTQHLNDQDESSAWNQYLFGFDKFKDQRDSTWNKASTVLMN